MGDDLGEMIDDMKEEYGSDFMEDQDLDRVLDEVLGDVEVWTESREGPDGPWEYKTLTVKRKHNSIFVDDVDGVGAAHLHIPDAEKQSGDLKEKLRKKLDELNEETLAEL